MTLNEILNRLIDDGYTDSYIDKVNSNTIIIPKKGEVELAHGEATIFDAKFAWPGYGDHACFKKIDDLFADIHATWPIKKLEETPCETSSNDSLPSSASVAEAIADKEENRVTAEENHD